MIYDLIIIGAGAAGYTAGIYASRYNMKVLIIGNQPGGLGATAHKVENWPGEPSISGSDLMAKFSKHIEKLNILLKQDLVIKLELDNGLFKIHTQKEKFQSKALVLALGTQHRHLNIPGEEEFKGKGVSYCATCDGLFFKDKTITVVGGGDSAFTATIMLSDIAKHIYLIYMEDSPKAMPAWIEKVEKKKNITTIAKNTITKISGDNAVEKIELKEKFQDKKELNVDGIFVEIGSVPNYKLIGDLKIDKTERNYIKVNPQQETNIPGVFAAGDVTTGSTGFAQLITASSEGAIAAFSAYKYLKGKN